MDIKPMKRRPNGSVGSAQPRPVVPTPSLHTPRAPAPQTSVSVPQPIESPSVSNAIVPAKKPKKKLLIVLLILAVVIVGLIASPIIWYQVQLSPLGTNEDEKIKVVVPKGASPDDIGNILEEQKVIRSNQAFGIYAKISGTQDILQAGTYRLSPAESTPEIVAHLTSGNVDSFDIRFLPGATLKQNRQVLIDADYEAAEVDAALSATYQSPLFDSKPANSDLEGYIYGDTYRFSSGATVGEILTHTFEIFNDVVKANDLAAKYKARGLSLYQGITLASIIQRESVGGDEAQIAQVFYTRLAQGMQLGSDVTYQYAADKAGVPRDTNLDSPYNTRRYVGLPPGPIATPGLAALKAVADPASGDYLFFLSGDDDVTYFARTDAEHQENIVNHCKVKCQII